MTRTAKHTPGPWAVEQCSAPVYGSDGSIIAEGIGIGAQSTHIGTVYGKNSSHNAHLIAAAPTMYEALKALVDVFPSVVKMTPYGVSTGISKIHDNAVAALAQAEGKQ